MSSQNRRQSCETRPEPCGDEGERSAPQEESADVLKATFSALSEVDDSTLSRWEKEIFEEYRAEQSALVPAATADPVTSTTYGPQSSPGAGDQGFRPLGGMNMINSIERDDSTQNPFGTTYSTGSAFRDPYRMGMGPCTQPRYPNTISSPYSSLPPPISQERHDMPKYQALMGDSPVLESTSMAAGPASGHPGASPSNPGGYRPPQEHMLLARPSPHERPADTAWFPPRDSSLDSASIPTSGNSRYQAGAPVPAMWRERGSGLSREPAFSPPLSIQRTPDHSPDVVPNSMIDRNADGAHLVLTPPWSGQSSSIGSPPNEPTPQQNLGQFPSDLDLPWYSIWRDKRQTFRTAVIRRDGQYFLNDPAAANEMMVSNSVTSRGMHFSTDRPEIEAVSAWLLHKQLIRHWNKINIHKDQVGTRTAMRRLSLGVRSLNLTNNESEVFARALDLLFQVAGQEMGSGILPVRLRHNKYRTLEQEQNALLQEYSMPADALMQRRTQGWTFVYDFLP